VATNTCAVFTQNVFRALINVNGKSKTVSSPYSIHYSFSMLHLLCWKYEQLYLISKTYG